MDENYKILIAVLSSGLAVFVLTQFLKLGKTKLTNHSLLLSYHVQVNINITDLLELDLEFTNTSGHSKIIRILEAKLQIGNMVEYFSVEGSPFLPSYVLKEKSIEVYHNVLYATTGKIQLNHHKGIHNDFQFHLKYLINKKEKLLIIDSKDFAIKDTTLKSMVL